MSPSRTSLSPGELEVIDALTMLGTATAAAAVIDDPDVTTMIMKTVTTTTRTSVCNERKTQRRIFLSTLACSKHRSRHQKCPEDCSRRRELRKNIVKCRIKEQQQLERVMNEYFPDV